MTVKDWDLEEGTDCKGIWGVMKIFDILTVVVITQLGTFVKTHQTVHLERVNFTVYKLYFNKSDFKIFLKYFLYTSKVRGSCFLKNFEKRYIQLY